ncbi:hypothetical protein [Zavarzinia sp. CC-PAN008]|uniref:hypothetical protein n=1 Tax=Zavarzinia sp. CC-PAN008 TaxID=3243332 RepID=UPI003F74642D
MHADALPPCPPSVVTATTPDTVRLAWEAPQVQRIPLAEADFTDGPAWRFLLAS